MLPACRIFVRYRVGSGTSLMKRKRMTFRLQETQSLGRHILLALPQAANQEGNGNYCTILIGRNGVGKSRLLAEVCEAFRSIENNGRWRGARLRDQAMQKRQDPFHLFYASGPQRVSLLFDRRRKLKAMLNDTLVEDPADIPLPQRVIATTITPFDKFPVDRSSVAEARTHLRREADRLYQYLGAKDRIGRLSPMSQMSRVIDSLMLASEKSYDDIQRLSGAFDFLGYLPGITVDYTFRIARDRLRKVLEIDPLDVEGLLHTAGIYKQSSGRYSRYSQTDPSLDSRVARALQAVAEHAQTPLLTIDLDFQQGTFRSGSLELYQHAQLLRSINILGFRDLQLIRRRLF